MTARWQRLRQLSQRYALVLVTVTLLAWLWGLMLWFDARQKEQLLADRASELALMAGAVAQHTASVLRSAESDLRSLDLWLLTHPQADPLRDGTFLRFVEEMRRTSKGLVDYRLVSPDGQLYDLPATAGQARADVSDREYVLAHAGSGCLERCPVHIGVPVQSRIDGAWVVPLSMLRSAASPTGAASPGLLLAIVSLDRLGSEHERMRYGSAGTIVLMRSDGVVLSRTPPLPGFVGSNMSNSVNFVDGFGRKSSGSFISDGQFTDQVRRLVSYERLRDYRVSALISRSLDDIVASHDRRLRTPLLASAVLSLLVLGFTFFLQHSRGSQRELQEQQDHFRRLATTDELTGVMNRRAFLDAASRKVERAQRYRRPTVLLALDIDHFKRINDSHGHAGGDLALRVCATRWQPALREHDLLGRIGGEEFCVLLPETTQAHAVVIAERLRSITNGTPVMGQVHVSVSIGWSALAEGDTVAVLMQRADEALYKAKHGGRNRVFPPA